MRLDLGKLCLEATLNCPPYLDALGPSFDTSGVQEYICVCVIWNSIGAHLRFSWPEYPNGEARYPFEMSFLRVTLNLGYVQSSFIFSMAHEQVPLNWTTNSKIVAYSIPIQSCSFFSQCVLLLLTLLA